MSTKCKIPVWCSFLTSASVSPQVRIPFEAIEDFSLKIWTGDIQESIEYFHRLAREITSSSSMNKIQKQQAEAAAPPPPTYLTFSERC